MGFVVLEADGIGGLSIAQRGLFATSAIERGTSSEPRPLTDDQYRSGVELTRRVKVIAWQLVQSNSMSRCQWTR